MSERLALPTNTKHHKLRERQAALARRATSPITYDLLISACEKGQQQQQAMRLLQEMLPRGLLPTVITYNAAISACEKGQNPRDRRCISGRRCCSETACPT